MRNNFPKREYDAPLHTLYKLYDVPIDLCSLHSHLRQCFALFANVGGWLILDIGWFVLFLWTGREVNFTFSFTTDAAISVSIIIMRFPIFSNNIPTIFARIRRINYIPEHAWFKAPCNFSVSSSNSDISLKVWCHQCGSSISTLDNILRLEYIQFKNPYSTWPSTELRRFP